MAVHRARKHAITEWALKAPGTRWHLAILGRLAGVIGKLAYEWFGKNHAALSVHDTITAGGVVSRAQQQLLSMLSGWVREGAPEWSVLDAVTGGSRATAPEEVRRFMRRNRVIYACGLFRRFELALSHSERPLHQLHCQERAPSAEDRASAWARFSALRRDCKSFFSTLR